MPAPLMKPNW